MKCNLRALAAAGSLSLALFAVTQVNSIYNGQRFEDLWLDR